MATDHSNEPRDLADLVDMVWADTEADFIRHNEARIRFMNRLVQHLHQQKLFSAWTIQTGLFPHAAQLRDQLTRFDMLKRKNAPLATLRDAEVVCTTHAHIFIQSLRAQVKPQVTSMIDHYALEELKLPWEWLRFELYRAWLTDLVGWITKTPQRLIYQPMPRKEIAPVVDYHFRTRDGESFPDMLARFKEETEKFLKEQTGEYNRAYPRGKLYSNQDVEKYVEWFFRSEILKEPLKRIAKYDTNGKERDWSQQPKDIKKYAKVVRGWLELGFSEDNLLKSGWGKNDDPGVEGEGS